ncbi:hypothetical protein PR048_027132 [Dryococelus australis]|uniref:Uncharacterized protein n=1 Tax=Dryococelus australis TaxID=614101 RepID=A0ABQ9GEL3_9NEOP|nr:hypothetical protein PR048_027132 [Dryococelus australis]
MQGQGERKILEKTPVTISIIRHDSHVRKPGSDPADNKARGKSLRVLPPNRLTSCECNATLTRKNLSNPNTGVNTCLKFRLTGFDSGGVAPGFPRVGIVPHGAAGRRGFLRDLPCPPPFHCDAVPYSPRFNPTLIGSQDLDEGRFLQKLGARWLRRINQSPRVVISSRGVFARRGSGLVVVESRPDSVVSPESLRRWADSDVDVNMIETEKELSPLKCRFWQHLLFCLSAKAMAENMKAGKSSNTRAINYFCNWTGVSQNYGHAENYHDPRKAQNLKALIFSLI